MTDFKQKLPESKIIEFLEATDECVVDLLVLLDLGVYTRKDTAVDSLKRNFKKGVEYSGGSRKTSRGGRPSDSYLLTSDCFKEMCLIAQTETGSLIRKYYLEVERRW